MRGFGLRRGRRCLLGLNAAIHEYQSRDGRARQHRRSADLAKPRAVAEHFVRDDHQKAVLRQVDGGPLSDAIQDSERVS